MKDKKNKQSLVFCLSAIFFCFSFLNSGFAGDWLDGANGYARGMEQAQSTGKPMLVYFYTDWCPYCRKFENNLLPQPEVKKALENFIQIRINPEKGAREGRLADQYRVRGYPSVYFFNPLSEKKAVEVSRASRSVKDFSGSAREFSRQTRELNSKRAKPEITGGSSTTSAETAESPDSVLYLKNGREVKGVFVSRDAKGITLRVSGLGEVYFSNLEFNKLEKIKE